MPQPAVRRSHSRQVSGVSHPEVPADAWEAAVQTFLAECRRRNLSAATLENYEWHLIGVRARAFLKDHGVKSPDDLTVQMLRTVEADLAKAGLSAQSVDTFHRILKNFLAFCLREGLGGSARVLELKGPKLEQKEPETFTPAFTDTDAAWLKPRLTPEPSLRARLRRLIRRARPVIEPVSGKERTMLDALTGLRNADAHPGDRKRVPERSALRMRRAMLWARWTIIANLLLDLGMPRERAAAAPNDHQVFVQAVTEMNRLGAALTEYAGS